MVDRQKSAIRAGAWLIMKVLVLVHTLRQKSRKLNFTREALCTGGKQSRINTLKRTKEISLDPENSSQQHISQVE